MFSLEYYEIFKSAFFHRTPLDGCLWSVIGQSNCGNRQLVKGFMWSRLTNVFLCLLNKRFSSRMFSPASHFLFPFQIKYHTFWWLFIFWELVYNTLWQKSKWNCKICLNTSNKSESMLFLLSNKCDHSLNVWLQLVW